MDKLRTLKDIIVGMVIGLALLMFVNYAQAGEKEYPEAKPTCENLVAYFDDRNKQFNNGKLVASHTKRGIYYCVARFYEDRVEYEIPVHLKFTYNYETDSWVAKRWGY